MLTAKTQPHQLTRAACEPCKTGTKPMTKTGMAPYVESVKNWKLRKEKEIDTLVREFEMKNFATVIAAVDTIAALAEAEGHHPNIYIYNYKQLRVELSTHKIKGLSVNDFILAAKIDAKLAM